ncbi:MAG: ABC transporter permease [Chlorobiaceae bacterium]|nr:ABC transporter permease [Chlorobiaceae bacterium]MBA4309742.1 ABC transporter permease [Chlorobiaceae bacterium]
MQKLKSIFRIPQPLNRNFTFADIFVLVAIAVAIYLGVRLSFAAPQIIEGPDISLDPSALPWYALFSLSRMFCAFLLSIAFALIYGRLAANNPSSQKVLLPLLDVLQSVPILSFLPVVVLSLSSFLPQGIALELSAVILIFTCQAWNMTFAWYQSLTTIPHDLREASNIFRFNGWLRFRTLEMPFAMISLIWNSMMSWAGGWFFLMAAEIFTVGQKDFRLPGLGSYLHEASNKGDISAIILGVVTLLAIIIALDQFIWRPLLAWSERYKLEMVSNETTNNSWFYNALLDARIINWFNETIFEPLKEKLDDWFLKKSQKAILKKKNILREKLFKILFALLTLAIIYGLYRTLIVLSSIELMSWIEIIKGIFFTFLRVSVALIIALLWTIPLGVMIGTKKKYANFLQPLIQIFASVPATALFPVMLIFMLQLPGGLDIAAILLMLMGTQWYLLFNVIAGASAIPQDLKYTAKLLRLNSWTKWKTLILPSLFPYLITGSIAASGGAWNASIVAEYVSFNNETYSTIGIGSMIAQATDDGNYTLLLAATLSMILTVVLINRFFWRRLYKLAEEKYHFD